MIGTAIASLLLGVLALLCAAISAVADRPFGWRLSAALFALVAVAVWWLP
jgi:hypothetical protein